MARITESIRAYFEREEWEGQEPDEGVFVFPFEDEFGHRWGCLAMAHEEAEQFVFYSVILEHVRMDRRAEVVAFIMRTNYGMQVGNYEMDLEDGEVRFKTSIDVEGTELTHTLINNLVNLNLMITSTYFDGLMAVMSGEKRALEVVGEFEANEDADDGEGDEDEDGDEGGDGDEGDDSDDDDA